MTKIVFMGTPDFAVPTLRALIRNFEVIAVMTQPDRPAGRGGKIRMSPVKQVAIDARIAVFQPEKIRQTDAIETLQQWEADVFVVAAFGQILPQKVLDIPPHGSINIHASLLPRWRGAAPIQAAIRAGDRMTGVTIMKMDAGLDTGPILAQASIPIETLETGESLHNKLAALGPDLLVNVLPGYIKGVIVPQPQPEEGVTIAPQIHKEEGRIKWADSAEAIERLVRAFTPWPGTYTTWQDRILKIHAGQIGVGDVPVGKVAQLNNRVVIGTAEGVYVPSRIQLEGKAAVGIDDFVHGYADFIGAELGQ